MSTVIFSAPQGWGKTRKARQLATEFGCKHWKDEWTCGEPMQANTLHLTNEHPDDIPKLTGVLVVARGWEGSTK